MHHRDLRDARRPTCSPGCRRCGRNARGRETPRPGSADWRRRNRPDRCRAAGSARAISCARRCFLTVIGIVGAALDRRVVGDDHALAPAIAADAGDRCRPPAPRRRTCRYAASCDSSRNGEPGSSSARTRSRGSSLPRARCRSRAAAPPPCLIAATLARRSRTKASIAAALARNASARGSTLVRITFMAPRPAGESPLATAD